MKAEHRGLFYKKEKEEEEIIIKRAASDMAGHAAPDTEPSKRSYMRGVFRFPLYVPGSARGSREVDYRSHGGYLKRTAGMFIYHRCIYTLSLRNILNKVTPAARTQPQHSNNQAHIIVATSESSSAYPPSPIVTLYFPARGANGYPPWDT